MKIERLLTVFDNKSEELIEEINIDYIEVEKLKMIFSPREGDPLMYMIYDIQENHAPMINSLLKEKISFDFNKNSYYLECAQLPPYSF